MVPEKYLVRDLIICLIYPKKLLFSVYNKELTQAEITANCNEVKGRFEYILTSSSTGTVDAPHPDAL